MRVSTPVVCSPVATRNARPRVTAARTRLPTRSTCRRDTRSITIAAKGPRIENGRRVMASTTAIDAASGCRCGEKSTYAASAT